MKDNMSTAHEGERIIPAADNVALMQGETIIIRQVDGREFEGIMGWRCFYGKSNHPRYSQKVPTHL